MIGSGWLFALLQGILVGAGICFTLGPQSVFVLRQGIRGESAFRIAAICTASDLLLIAAAAAGANAIVMTFPDAARYGIWGGAVFTLAFGCLALASAFRPRPAEIHKPAGARLITAALALSLAVNASGTVSLEMVPLISPKQMDEAVKVSVKYRAPGA